MKQWKAGELGTFTWTSSSLGCCERKCNGASCRGCSTFVCKCKAVCLCNPAQLLRLPGNLLTLTRVTQFVCITSVLFFLVAWSAATVMKMGVQQQLKLRKWHFPKFRSSTSPLSLIMTSSSTASSPDFFAWWRVWRMADLLLQTGCWETLPWQPDSHCVRQS